MKKITENCSVCTACVSKCPKSAINISKKVYNEIKVNKDYTIIKNDLSKKTVEKINKLELKSLR